MGIRLESGAALLLESRSDMLLELPEVVTPPAAIVAGQPRTFWRTFTSPFRTTSRAISTEVPSRYAVALNGRGYMLDLDTHDFGMQTIQISRAQSDTTASPSEASLSREDLWRRAFESWHHGAGQMYRDRNASDEFRFRSSLGVDVWNRDTLSLLPVATQTLLLTSATPLLATTDSHVYASNETTVSWSTDGNFWTTATGLGGQPVLGMCSDGSKVYVSDGANIYQSNPGGVFASWNALNASLLDFVNGRLMAAGAGATKNIIYNVTDAGVPTYSFTHPNVDWTWTAFASGQQALYAAGYAGDKSAIYSITIKADGSGLDVPVVALALPDGERVLSLHGYLDFLAIGTTAGLRLAALGSTLTAGSPLDVPPVYAIEGQERFLWFGWTNYDDTHTGLGRADLSVFDSPLTPAYASDLMAHSTSGILHSVAAQGITNAVATFAGKRLFAVAGSGVWTQTATLVTSGTLDTGWVTFGLPDRKVLETIDVRTEPLQGSLTVAVAGTSGLFSNATPVHDQPGSVGIAMNAGEESADRFELRLTLARLTTAVGPSVSRVTLLANPSPSRSKLWILPLLLGDAVKTLNGTPKRYQSGDEVEFIGLLADSGVLCTLQLGGRAFTVLVTEYQWRPTHIYKDHTDWNGTLTVSAKELQRRGD